MFDKSFQSKLFREHNLLLSFVRWQKQSAGEHSDIVAHIAHTY